MQRGERPIVIKRVIEPAHAGHHGGAWKVAYADFVTAMMAFFLLLWLISSASEDTLKGLADYFNDATVNTGPPGGSGALLNGRTLLPMTPTDPLTAISLATTPPPSSIEQPEADPQDAFAALAGLSTGAISEEAFEAEQERREGALFDQARATIEAALEAEADLRAFRENLLIDQTPEGLRVQIVDQDRQPMFPIGSDRMYPPTRRLLELVVRAIGPLPNRVSVRGHTDALPFAAGRAYDNWRLSSDRANSTREVMVELGLPAGRVAEVIGKGDGENLIVEDPKDPRNRRISLVLLHEAAAPAAREGPSSLPAASGRPHG